MLNRSSKPKKLGPEDPNEAAARILRQATGEEPPEAVPEKPIKDPAAVELGRKGGLKGGKARAEKLSPAKRSAIAKKAAKKRWGHAD